MSELDRGDTTQADSRLGGTELGPEAAGALSSQVLKAPIPLPPSLGQLLGPHISGSVLERSAAPDSRGGGASARMSPIIGANNAVFAFSSMYRHFVHKVTDSVD